MVCFMETISRDVQRHEPLQFSVITIFHGKATGVINNVWVIVNLKSSCYKGSFQKRFSGFCPLRGYPPPSLTENQCEKRRFFSLAEKGGTPPP